MTSIISDDRAFFVNIKDPSIPELEGYELSDAVNPLAQGIAASPEPAEPKIWGYFSWFDTANANMRTIELKKAPVIDSEKKVYEVTTPDGITYLFHAVDKQIYDSTLRFIMPNLPDQQDDASVQRYLSSLNPYL